MNAVVERAVTRSLMLATPEVFVPLLGHHRYKGIHGGRGSGKSWFVAEGLVEDALAEPGESGGEGLLTVCIREVQKDLTQSSKRLIESKLRTMGLGTADGFRIYEDVITTPGDGIFIFKGMNNYNADSIKSLEGFKRSWWEEAHNATAPSLTLLRPTLRKDGSQRIFTWNPTRKAAPIEHMLRGAGLPTGAVVVESNWRDNPFFTAELEQERQDCLRTQPDQYPHIWEGKYITALEGAYYAKSLNAARLAGRVGAVGRDPLLTNRAFVDIGGTGAHADAFVIWIIQFIGREIRALDYYEAVGQPIGTHLEWMRSRGYTPKNTEIWLPHDGEANDKVHDNSYASALGKGDKGAGYHVEVVPNQGKGAAKMRIEAGRRHFPSFWFNVPTIIHDPENTPHVQGGLEALGWYHEKKDDARNIGLGPEHDWSSHGSDAFGLACVCADKIFAEMGRVPVSGDEYGKGWR